MSCQPIFSQAKTRVGLGDMHRGRILNRCRGWVISAHRACQSKRNRAVDIGMGVLAFTSDQAIRAVRDHAMGKPRGNRHLMPSHCRSAGFRAGGRRRSRRQPSLHTYVTPQKTSEITPRNTSGGSVTPRCVEVDLQPQLLGKCPTRLVHLPPLSSSRSGMTLPLPIEQWEKNPWQSKNPTVQDL